jgi:hypothetical protein
MSYQTILRHPVKVNTAFPILYVSDLALTEPGKDTVTIEATKDGINWLPINIGYDASAHEEWLTAYNTSTSGTTQLFRESSYDLSQKFSDGDTLLFRLQLKTNNTAVGWGWAINYVTIQLEPLSVNPETASNFRLFPNPASDKITIEYTLSKPSPVHYQLININGQSMLKRELGLKSTGQQSENIPITNYPMGSYILILNTNAERKAVRFTIQR